MIYYCVYDGKLSRPTKPIEIDTNEYHSCVEHKYFRVWHACEGKSSPAWLIDITIDSADTQTIVCYNLMELFQVLPHLNQLKNLK